MTAVRIVRDRSRRHTGWWWILTGTFLLGWFAFAFAFAGSVAAFVEALRRSTWDAAHLLPMTLFFPLEPIGVLSPAKQRELDITMELSGSE